MRLTRLRSTLFVVFAVIGVVVTAACGGDSSPAATTHNATDDAFVVAMARHHQRAIEVGQFAADKGSDPRVVDYGRLIVSQQTPELQKLDGWKSQWSLLSTAAGSSMPDGYITDPTLAGLRTMSGTAFDRAFLLDSANSETGAAAMAQRELASGVYGPARELATSISTAPTTQIPKLRALAAQLG
ncbi:DUF305 domain-containing protein [Williamsia serinedens]|uniref:Uncharacterized conserved protein, DUF305 family n=1 Tax=Williamsia serinedens TaxID=391736 RepID=A0ABT1H2I3_9NOCA|nr:DUF305 domain-containing protein [Williamsia serinedens]MCP2161184.1 Uncharacterized conserved protein, DUF305 family [Williamsia serinedens]